MEAAAQVLAFFTFGTDSNVYAVISRYTPLSETDARLDPYRQFGMVAGCLYYDKLEAPTVIRASNFLMSFAKTPFKLENITQPVVHALPLYKVRRFILVTFSLQSNNCFPWPSTYIVNMKYIQLRIRRV